MAVDFIVESLLRIICMHGLLLPSPINRPVAFIWPSPVHKRLRSLVDLVTRLVDESKRALLSAIFCSTLLD